MEDWLPENERSPSVDMGDASLFPMKISSVVALSETGQQIRLLIQPDGSEGTW
jgi:hypothetical protein